MATRNIVPRANGEGAIGDNTIGVEKYWGGGYFNTINGANAIEMSAFNDSLQWKASRAYAKGSIVFTSGLSAGMYLECLVDGTSNTDKFAIPSSIVPNTTTITDNTVTWIVRQLANTASLSQAGERQKSTAYVANNMASLATLPYGWYLECTAGGITSADDLVITSPTVGATVTDGAVVWIIREVASTADIPAPVDISGKANIDLDNLSPAGEAKIQSVSRYLTDSYYDSTTGDWYRVYSDGWVEQGGIDNDGTLGAVVCNLLKPMLNDKYLCFVELCKPKQNANGGYTFNVPVKSTTTVTIYNYNANSGPRVFNWMICGMGA